MEINCKETPKQRSHEKLNKLPSHLKYSFFGGKSHKHVILNDSFTEGEKHKLMKILEAIQKVIDWTLANLKGIKLFDCMNIIMMEENSKPIA